MGFMNDGEELPADAATAVTSAGGAAMAAKDELAVPQLEKSPRIPGGSKGNQMGGPTTRTRCNKLSRLTES